MTYKEYKKQILLKLDEYEAENPKMTDDSDLLEKIPYAINEAVRFASYGKNTKHNWNVIQGEKFNLLENTIGEHRNEDVVFEADGGYGYYFEVDDNAEITITANDTNIPKIIHGNSKTFRDFVAYKDIIGDIAEGAHVKITFGGNSYYKIRNVCIYSVRFSSKDKMPDYNGYCIHEIPKELYQVENVYRLDKDEKVPVEFKVLGDKLYLPESPGVYEIESTFFPMLVDKGTADDCEITVAKDIEYIIIQKACAFLSQDGDYAEFVSDSEQMMQMLDKSRGASAPTIRRLARID